MRFAPRWYRAARLGRTGLTDSALWALAFAMEHPRYRGLRAQVVREPELAAWLAAESEEEAGAHFARGIASVGPAAVRFVLSSSAFRAAQAEAGEPPREDSMSDKTQTETDAAPGDDEEEASPELLAQLAAWRAADDAVAAGVGQPLTLRIAERQRDAAARQIADLVDDDVLDDSLIIDTWPEISRYGRAVGWSTEQIAKFLSGPKNLFPVPEGDEGDGDEGEEKGEGEGDKGDEDKGDEDKGDDDAPPPDAKFLKLRDKASEK